MILLSVQAQGRFRSPLRDFSANSLVPTALAAKSA